MEEQSKVSITHSPDLSDQQSSNAWHDHGQNIGAVMSNEELKIRGELEMDIERDLEEEIKNGIYHLALRLHRLYQHQKERNNDPAELSKPGSENQQVIKKKTVLSEVNISIKMEGGTKIEFKEVKKETPERTRPRTLRSDDVAVVPASTKRFDWAKSLRSPGGPVPVAIDKKNGSFDKARVQRNSAIALGQRREKTKAEKKLLELGWTD